MTFSAVHGFTLSPLFFVSFFTKLKFYLVVAHLFPNMQKQWVFCPPFIFHTKSCYLDGNELNFKVFEKVVNIIREMISSGDGDFQKIYKVCNTPRKTDQKIRNEFL